MDLALSTSTKCGSISLFNDETLVFEKKSLEQKSHSEAVHAFIDEGLRSNNSDWTSIKRVFIDHGPGSFTGIRVSLNLAKSLSYGLGVPIYTFNSLSLLAYQAFELIQNPAVKFEEEITQVLTIINAYKNMVYYSMHSVSTLGIQELSPPSVLPVQELREKINSPCLVVGDGYSAYESYLNKNLGGLLIRNELCFDFPLAKSMGQLVYKSRFLPPALDWNSTLPLYIRSSEAEENKRGILFKPLE